jgi:hypothetical protein
VLFVYPGPHQLEATAKDRSSVTKEARVEAGERVEVALEMAPLSEAGLHHRKGEKKAPFGLGIPFWVSVGVTGAAGTLAIVFGALTVENKKEFEDSGSTDTELKEQGENYRLVTNVMIGVTAAAALTAAGFAIYDLVYKKKKKEKQDRAQVAIVPGPGLGVGVILTF